MFIVSVDQAVGDVPPNFIALIPEKIIISDDISKNVTCQKGGVDL